MLRVAAIGRSSTMLGRSTMTTMTASSRQRGAMSTVCHHRRSLSFVISRETVSSSPRNSHLRHQQQQFPYYSHTFNPGFQRLQRRTYVFWPSDWSELTYRFKLWWEQNQSPTKIKIVQWKDRYQRHKSNLQHKYRSTKSRLLERPPLAVQTFKAHRGEWRDKYQRQKARTQAYWIQNRKRIKSKRSEFSKRWKARRREMVQDSKTFLKGYYYYRQKQLEQKRQQQQLLASSSSSGSSPPQQQEQVFTITEYCQPEWFCPIDGRPLTSKDPTGRFVNPWLSWSTNGVHTVTNILKWRYQRALRLIRQRGWWSLVVPQDWDRMLFGNNNNNINNTGTSAAAINVSSGAVDEGTKQDKEESQQSPESSNNNNNNNNNIELTWIGHSTCLVRMGGATILTDPMFSHRCSPFQRVPGVGVPREVPPSLAVDELPSSIDVCLISHDHYDHLDYGTVRALRDRVQRWVLPVGLPEWLETRCSVDPERMVELEWWQSVHYTKMAADMDTHWCRVEGSPYGQSDPSMTITCLPAQHWSSRNFFDRCKRLWCSFSVETTQPANISSLLQSTNSQQPQLYFDDAPNIQKFYFAGDSGMPRNGFPLFHQIGEFCAQGRYHHDQHNRQQPHQKSSTTPTDTTNPIISPSAPILEAANSANQSYSTKGPTQSPVFHPFDLVALPIGAYQPEFLMRDAHMNPAEAVQCAQHLQARNAVAIHWGTFALSEEDMDEPPLALQRALQKKEEPAADKLDFVTLPIGGSMHVDCSSPPSWIEDEWSDVDDMVDFGEDEDYNYPEQTG